MKKIFFSSLFFALLTLSGCLDEPAASDVTITFKAVYDGQPLEKYKQYDYDTYRVQFTRFNTFMANIGLISGNSVLALSDIGWVDFTPDSAPTDKAVDVSATFSGVPDGTYSGLHLGYGVPKALNALQPKDFAAGHPLSRENEFWLGWGSYIFNKIEGQVDLNNNGVFDGGLIYHCGSDAVYREYEFYLPITVGPGARNIVVEFDLKKLFVISGTWLDLNDPYNHITSNDANDVVIAKKLMDNFDTATTVKQ
ncbi:MAG: MbnP family protein [Saprospiraceae bacterium]